jgi:hypothetical protein
MVRFFLPIVFLPALIIAFSCSKPEGEGGKSSIEGKVYRIDFISDDKQTLDTFPATDYDVYIVYGKGSLQDDRSRTNYQGEFIFRHLREGSYSIYVYGNSPDDRQLEIAEVVEVKLGKKSAHRLDDIIIYTSNNGHASVSGNVYAAEYDKGGFPKGTVSPGDIDIYLCRKGDSFYLERTRTHHGGTFRFTQLRRGEYYVYAYSKDVSDPANGIPIIPVKQEFSIEDFAQQVVLDTLYVND